MFTMVTAEIWFRVQVWIIPPQLKTRSMGPEFVNCVIVFKKIFLIGRKLLRTVQITWFRRKKFFHLNFAGWHQNCFTTKSFVAPFHFYSFKLIFFIQLDGFDNFFVIDLINLVEFYNYSAKLLRIYDKNEKLCMLKHALHHCMPESRRKNVLSLSCSFTQQW